ncbi:MAG: hypothetical protein ACTSVE_11070 [Candidatus Helarchaeota archaeon]
MELPIRNIVLYKTGIGYFQRRGKIKGNMLKLNFKQEMMNDILATLTILTTNSQVTGVSYESENIDLQTALEDALIKLTPQETFLTLLKQVIGCKISLEISSTTYEGIMLGLQDISTVIEENIVDQKNLVLQQDNGTILNLPVLEIRNFKILDEKMQTELEYFIQKIYESKKENNKTLTIFFNNVPSDGDEVEINYLQEIPAWKCSYRLVFTEEQVMIQGWSMVDNILDEDWINVNLSLIAGLPISFIYDLYSPAWIDRPEVERKDKYDITVAEFEEKELEYDKVYTAEKKKAIPLPSMAPPAPGGPPRRPRVARELSMAPMAKQEAFNMDDEYSEERAATSVKVTTEGEAEGDFFQYRVGVPITVVRNQSSLVPIIQQHVKGKKISVYNETARKNNPMLTIELDNDSDLTLEEGPISIYDGARFAGEAMLPFMKKGETRRIPYAVDLGISVDKKLKTSNTNTHEIKIESNGVHSFYYYVKEVVYNVKNKTSDEEREIIIEHPIETNYELFDTVEPFEKSANYYRFKLKIPAKKSEKLIIKTKYLQRSVNAFRYVTKSFIENLLKLKLISEKENEMLQELVKLTNDKELTQISLNEIIDKKDQIFNDQSRLRKNLKSLKETSSEIRLRNKYIEKLAEQENQLEEIEINIKDLKAKLLSLNEKLYNLVSTYEIKSK